MSLRQLVPVALGERSYDILVGTRLIEEGGALLAPVLARPRVVVVTDANVAALHLERLTASLARVPIAHDTVVLPPARRPRTGRTSRPSSTACSSKRSSARPRSWPWVGG